jgi:hypothetical protein
MPHTAKQKRLFQAAAHSPAVAKKVGMSKKTAKRLAAEGERAATLPPAASPPAPVRRARARK